MIDKLGRKLTPVAAAREFLAMSEERLFSRHAINDILSELLAERVKLIDEIATSNGKVIFGFYEGKIPVFTQGGPVNELQKLVTAGEVTGYVQELLNRAGSMAWAEQALAEALDLPRDRPLEFYVERAVNACKTARIVTAKE